jgi:predicted transposase/invertase (TIGR01784 family)
LDAVFCSQKDEWKKDCKRSRGAAHIRLLSSETSVHSIGECLESEFFPEHYLIRVATFPDQINEALDEWIYMLKHSEVRPEFTAKHIQDASTRLQVMNLDPEQRRAYERYMENVSYQESMLWSSRIEEKIAIAKKLLAHGVTADIIRASTGLSAQELDRLRKTVRQQAC